MAIATLKVQKGKDTSSMPKLLHFSELFCTASPHFANIVGRHGSSHSHWTLETYTLLSLEYCSKEQDSSLVFFSCFPFELVVLKD